MALVPHAPGRDELPYEETLSPRDYWRVLVRRRGLILGVTGVIAVATALFTLWQPAIYQSTAALMPLGQPRSGLSATLSAVSGLLPTASGLVKEHPADRLVAILESRTLALNVIEYLHLLPLLFQEQWDAAQQQWRTSPPPTLQDGVRKLNSMVSVRTNRQGVITIAVEYTDPEVAAAIANRYIAALQQALNENAFSLGTKNRMFIAEQLEKTRQNLQQAEEALKQFEQTYKIISLPDQTSAAVRAMALLEEQIMSREVQLGVQQRLLKGASREVFLIEEELRGLRAQLARLQYGAPMNSQTVKAQIEDGDVWIALHEAPEVKLHYTRLQREALVQGQLFTLLAQQLEQAKIDEARDETAFQVIDHAFPPDRKSKPKRALIVMSATFVGTFLGVFLAFLRDYLDATVRTEEQVERYTGLPLLAAIPVPPVKERHCWFLSDPVGQNHTSLPALHAATREALRYLHIRLRHLNGQQPVQTVLFTHTGADEDASLLLVQLAMVAASTGERTLLIDMNCRCPTLHRLLHCRLTPGFADLLATPDRWQEGMQHTAVANLHVVTSGAVPSAMPGAPDLHAFDTLLDHYRAAYDLILCMSPALPAYTDVAVLSNKVDATCFVLTCGVSRLDTVLA
ncbi:MAG: exopolysaccharide transport family protein, partial [candidate division KSB1 bacterium]|nr:exopolysaccharide transport family protein [candidate division KSB1 bacterium]